MKDFILYKNHYILDLLVSILTGFYAGYYGRIEADSGLEFHPDLYFRGGLVGALALLAAYLISLILQQKLRFSPNFLLLVTLGPIFFGIGYRGMMYIEWLQEKPFTLIDFIGSEGSSALAFATIYIIPFLFFLVFARFLSYLVLIPFRNHWHSSGI